MCLRNFYFNKNLNKKTQLDNLLRNIDNAKFFLTKLDIEKV